MPIVYIKNLIVTLLLNNVKNITLLILYFIFHIYLKLDINIHFITKIHKSIKKNFFEVFDSSKSKLISNIKIISLDLFFISSNY